MIENNTVMSSVFVNSEEEVTFRERNSIGYDERIVPLLTDISRAPKQELMSLILISGHVGTGKTLLGLQWAAYLDPNFTIRNVVFNHEDLINLANAKNPDGTWVLPKGSCIVWDEAREGSMSKRAMSQVNQRVGLFLDTIRSRCLFIIFIMPDFFNFEQGIAVESSDLFLHVYKVKNKVYDRNDDDSMPFERGYYNVYSRERKNMLYWKGKKYHRYSACKPSISKLRFKGRWPIDKKEYQSKKDYAVAVMNEAAEVAGIKDEMTKDKVSALRNKYLKSFKTNWPSITVDNFSKLCGEPKKLLLAAMDYECRQMYGVPHFGPKKRD